MSFRCVICGKQARSGKSVSHSHKASLRSFKPNLSRQKIILNGKPTREYVCTSCIKSGRVVKAL